MFAEYILYSLLIVVALLIIGLIVVYFLTKKHKIVSKAEL